MQKITLAIQTVYKCHIWDNSLILISTNAIPFFNSHTLGPYWEPPPWMSDLTSPTHHNAPQREEVWHWDMAIFICRRWQLLSRQLPRSVWDWHAVVSQKNPWFLGFHTTRIHCKMVLLDCQKHNTVPGAL